MAALVTAAHRRGKLAIVHVNSLAGAMNAVSAGADGLAHLWIGESSDYDPEFAHFAASHHVFIVPTLSVLSSVCKRDPGKRLLDDPRLASRYPSPDSSKLLNPASRREPAEYGVTLKTMHDLEAAQVPILAGTDAPNPGTDHGISLHGELEYLVEAGMSPVQALRAATSIPAKAFRLPDRGTIAPGKRADLLLVNGDPTRTITDTRNIVLVVKAGKIMQGPSRVSP